MAAYVLQIAEANQYLGYRAFPIDLPYLAAASLAVGVTGLLIPDQITRPSAFFPLFFGVFVLMPYAVFYPIRDQVRLDDFLVHFCLMAFPLVAVRLVVLSVPPIRFPSFFGQGVLIGLIACFCLVGVGFALAKAPSSAGFDLATAYRRRFEGREVFAAGTALAYMNAAIANSFAPLLAFLAGWRRSAALFTFAMICSLAYVYVLGLKAPVAYAALAFLVGYAAQSGKTARFVRYVYSMIVGALAIFFVEYLAFGYSFAADYFLRRAFVVPPSLVAAYFEAMSARSTIYWTPFEGAATAERISFAIGEQFLGIPGSNANANAFLHQLAAGGVAGYVFAILLVAAVSWTRRTPKSRSTKAVSVTIALNSMRC